MVEEELTCASKVRTCAALAGEFKRNEGRTELIVILKERSDRQLQMKNIVKLMVTGNYLCWFYL